MMMTLTGADVPRIFSTGSLTVTNSKLSRILKKIKQHTVTNAHWYNRTINYKITPGRIVLVPLINA